MDKFCLAVLIPISIAFTGCINADSVIGDYERLYHPDYVGVSLREDHSFEYVIATDLCETLTIMGKWEQNGRQIHLVPDIPPILDSDYGKIEESYIEGVDSVEFQVFENDSTPIWTVNIYIQDGKNRRHFQTDRLGWVKMVPEKNINNILISAVARRGFSHKVEKRVSNHFDVYLSSNTVLSCEMLQIIENWIWEKGKLFPLDKSRVFNRKRKNEVFSRKRKN